MTGPRGPVVIVGAGHAGVQVADSLRTEGYDGRVVLLDTEAGPPYQRPPLSKEFLSDAAGLAEPSALPLRGGRFFADRDIELHSGMTVTGVHRASSEVVVTDAHGRVERIPYESLVLATGARSRTITLPGSDAEGIHELRTLDDARGLRQELLGARRVVVVGAGFIGLEFAAAVRARGISTTVLEFADRPMARALTPALSRWMADAHRGMGTDLHFGAAVDSFDVDDGGRVRAVRTADGRLHPADLVLLGVGVQPRTELAEAAGLAVANGIVVDERLRTSDPRIVAIGDCASFPDEGLGMTVRLESVQNATDQARFVARSIVTGHAEAYSALPVFWSHQGSVKLQIAGLASPDDVAEIVGDPASGRFSIRCVRNGAVRAVETVGDPRGHLAAKRELAVPVR